MKVTPIARKFGKFLPGDVFDLPDNHAKLFIKLGKVSAVATGDMTYQTRMLQAAPVSGQVMARPELVAESLPASSENAQALVATDAPELDSEGNAWDSALHVATKLKNGDGTWRKKAVRVQS